MNLNNLKIGVVGATGMVGRTFISLLEEKNISPKELRLFASEKSSGQKLDFCKKEISIQSLSSEAFKDLNLVFFSSGDEISKEWAPIAVKSGAFAIDNSAAFRMDQEIPLIVPEVNGHLLDQIKNKPQIIANPNCTTIQLVVALKPILDEFGIDSVKIASYQAVSGAGQEAYNELLTQVAEQSFQAKVFPHPIAFNCIPQIGSIQENGFSSEEIKVIKESKKILNNQTMKVSAFTVRVPVLNAHAEVVWVTLKSTANKNQILDVLQNAEGVIIQDEPKKGVYPLQYSTSGKNEVYVGRIHQDLDDPQTWCLWIVADNIRKGAAYNGLQIAQRIFDKR